MQINLNLVRYNITNAIRQLECLLEYLIEDDDSSLYSEVAYWLTTLEMLRGYFSVDNVILDEKKMPVFESLTSVIEELKNAYIFEAKRHEAKVREHLVAAWSFCIKTKRFLCQK